VPKFGLVVAIVAAHRHLRAALGTCRFRVVLNSRYLIFAKGLARLNHYGADLVAVADILYLNTAAIKVNLGSEPFLADCSRRFSSETIHGAASGYAEAEERFHARFIYTMAIIGHDDRQLIVALGLVDVGFDANNARSGVKAVANRFANDLFSICEVVRYFEELGRGSTLGVISGTGHFPTSIYPSARRALGRD
jgi:hypothetical protein